jgi:SAM-dependent methyltransferase
MGDLAREERSIRDSLRAYWDADAATYDMAPGHVARTPEEQAAWRAVLIRQLPLAPARILDLGAGTGFLSIALAKLGHRVTAVDLSREMLDRLRDRARREGLDIALIEGPAEHPPEGPFDAVVERLLLWTLPDPSAALRRWRQVARGGRLVCFEGAWGRADRGEAIRARLREMLRRFRRRAPEHHKAYPEHVLACLPFSRGVTLPAVVESVERAGWDHVRLERLRDVEWTKTISLPFWERMLGVTPEFAIVAEDSTTS